MSKKTQYDALGQAYAQLTTEDPSKQFVQYPGALKLLGSIQNASVLDVGCGSGEFTRMLLSRAAKVVGYDISPEQIKLAKKGNEKTPLKARYYTSRPENLTWTNQFDLAVSVMTLPYAPDKQHLKTFFLSTFKALKSESKFVAVVFNPNFTRFGELLYRRRFSKDKSNKIKVEFFGQVNTASFSAKFSNFSAADYKIAAKAAGFKKLEWVKLAVEKIGIQKLGTKFWKGYENDCPYTGFVAYK